MLAQFTAHIRSSIRQARKNLSIATQTHASLQLARRIAKHPSFRKAKSFAAYIAINGEISLKPLIKLGLAQGKNCYIPVICNNHIYFTAYTARTKMRTNQFGIAEPRCIDACELSKIDLILCPLVAFDENGHRLGMGGGYYDRALKKHTPRRSQRLLGVAFDLQKVPKLITQPWDKPMEAIITPSRVYNAKK